MGEKLQVPNGEKSNFLLPIAKFKRAKERSVAKKLMKRMKSA